MTVEAAEILRAIADVRAESGQHGIAEQIRQAAALIEEHYEALAGIIPSNVCLTNRNVRDDAVVSLGCTMGDLRKAASVLAKARGEA